MRKMIALLATVALMLFGGAATALAESHAPPQNPPCDAGNAGEHNPNCDEEANFTPGTPGQGDRAVEGDLIEHDGADADAAVEDDLTEDDAVVDDGVVEEDAGEDGAGGFVAELVAALTALFGSSAA